MPVRGMLVASEAKQSATWRIRLVVSLRNRNDTVPTYRHVSAHR